MKGPKKAVILCAGLGIRMLPASKGIAKEMFPIVDTPVMDFLVQELISCGIKDILFVVSKQKQSVINYFKNGKANFYYIFPNAPKGVTDALYLAKSFVGDDNFVLLFGDVLFMERPSSIFLMIEACKKLSGSVLLCKSVSKKQISNYGCVRYNKKTKQLVDIAEKPLFNCAPSNLAVMGQYVLAPTIFKYLKNRRRLFTDCLSLFAQKNALYVITTQNRFFDIGSKSGYIKAFNYYAKHYFKP